MGSGNTVFVKDRIDFATNEKTNDAELRKESNTAHEALVVDDHVASLRREINTTPQFVAIVKEDLPEVKSKPMAHFFQGWW